MLAPFNAPIVAPPPKIPPNNAPGIPPFSAPYPAATLIPVSPAILPGNANAFPPIGSNTPPANLAARVPIAGANPLATLAAIQGPFKAIKGVSAKSNGLVVYFATNAAGVFNHSGIKPYSLTLSSDISGVVNLCHIDFVLSGLLCNSCVVAGDGTKELNDCLLTGEDCLVGTP